MDKLGILSGTMPLLNLGIFDHLQKEMLDDDKFGKVDVLASDDLVFIARHGQTDRDFNPPHLINHLGHFQTLADRGVREVIGIYSTGSLKAHLKPGMLMAPDDFICLYPTPTSVTDAPHHITPGIDADVRLSLIETAKVLEIDIVEGGIYWQTAGPRLETRAEIRMMAGIVDIVGMTLASEAVLAREFGMAFGAVCSIDNYANGISTVELKDADIRSQAKQNAKKIGAIVSRYIEMFRIKMHPAGRV
jgi:5'-methylthioadenosine phosphorylase